MKCYKATCKFTEYYAYRNTVLSNGSIYVFADSLAEAARLAEAWWEGKAEEVLHIEFIGEGVSCWTEKPK